MIWRVCAQTQLPLLVKGLLHVDDAPPAVALGCNGLVVSNHGGRIIDGTPTSLATLECFRQAFDASTPLLLDSGISRDDHAVKAMALTGHATVRAIRTGCEPFANEE